jgi:hypothetical protein
MRRVYYWRLESSIHGYLWAGLWVGLLFLKITWFRQNQVPLLIWHHGDSQICLSQTANISPRSSVFLFNRDSASCLLSKLSPEDLRCPFCCPFIDIRIIVLFFFS